MGRSSLCRQPETKSIGSRKKQGHFFRVRGTSFPKKIPQSVSAKAERLAGKLAGRGRPQGENRVSQKVDEPYPNERKSTERAALAPLTSILADVLATTPAGRGRGFTGQ